MFKKIIAVSALLLAPAAASAADLPRRSAAVAPAPYASPVFAWSGFYAGVNAGYGWGDSKFSAGRTGSAETDGWLAGGQLGYNHQMGSFVLGAEGDLNWADVSGSAVCQTAPQTCSSKLNYLGSARARAGFAANNVLFYGTGGFGFGGLKLSDTTGASASEMRVGWTAGAGMEYAVDRNWSVKAEYLHYDLGKETFGAASAKTTVDAAKLGVNYRFGAPAVSRY
jgi:outer membrane immunogenic protein